MRYIEIIRGTSGELDVRGGTQVINVVLNDALSSVSFAYEVNMDRALDGTLIPGGKIAATGQYGALNYFSALSASLVMTFVTALRERLTDLGILPRQ